MEVWLVVYEEQDEPSNVLGVHKSKAGADAQKATFSKHVQLSVVIQGPFTVWD